MVKSCNKITFFISLFLFLSQLLSVYACVCMRMFVCVCMHSVFIFAQKEAGSSPSGSSWELL